MFIHTYMFSLCIVQFFLCIISNGPSMFRWSRPRPPPPTALCTTGRPTESDMSNYRRSPSIFVYHLTQVLPLAGFISDFIQSVGQRDAGLTMWYYPDRVWHVRLLPMTPDNYSIRGKFPHWPIFTQFSEPLGNGMSGI